MLRSLGRGRAGAPSTRDTREASGLTASGPAGQAAAMRAAVEQALDRHVRLADGSCTGCDEAPCSTREAAVIFVAGWEFGYAIRAVTPDEQE